MSISKHQIEKIPTNIVGFDDLTIGGLPRGRAAVVSGAAGSGKTIFGSEFLYRGAVDFGEPGVFVTFEERREDIIAEMNEFGWDFAGLEKKGLVAFVDASRVAENQVEIGEYDFGALIARIRHAISRIGAKRVLVDSIGALFLRYRDKTLVRREMFKAISILRQIGVTTVITAERLSDSDTVSRFGVEDFVADSVVFLYNSVVGRQRERQIEIVKLRGGDHQTGKYPMLISSDGITVFPREAQALPTQSPTSKISLGVKGIDDMMDGGVYRGSTTLIIGPSGAGRTVFGLHFLNEGVRRRERCVLFSFEEGDAQIMTDARSLGMDFDRAKREKLLQIKAWPAESMPVEAFLKSIKRAVDDFKPRRVVIDSVTPFITTVDQQRFRRFIISLNSYLKSKLVTGVINYATGTGLETAIAAESELSVVADNIIILRFAESEGKMERVMSIAKSRASAHDKGVKRFAINSGGLCLIGEPDCVEGPSKRPGKGSKLRKKTRR
jgi:circadian clock protein KaiC